MSTPHGSHSEHRDKNIRPDGHLSDEVLLLAIDGEISSSEAAKVQAHIEACWACRARKEHIEQAITGVVEYQDAVLRPAIPPISSNLPTFVARLDRMAAELGHPALWRRLLRGGLNLGRVASLSRPVWITALALIVVASSYLFLTRISKVSADELLRRAEVSESKALSSVSDPVVYQKLRIAVGGRSITRTSYRDPVRRRNSTQLSAGAVGAPGVRPLSPQEEHQIREVFRQASLDWDEPLSPTQYGRWRQGLAGRSDQVVELGTDLLEVRTTTDSGPIAEASLSVRTSDFHPLSETVKLRDHGEIEITEIAWQVLSLEALNPAILEPPSPAAEAVQPRISELASPTPAHSPAELADIELQVRLALHDVGADLGDEIDIHAGQSGPVVVEGLTSTEDRKRQLLAALESIPLAQVHVQTLNEAAAKQPPTELQAHPPVMTIASAPLLDKSLKQQFPNAEQRTVFINQTLALAQGASARIWALRRLADRYTPAEVALLRPSSRQKLETLVSDHVTALQQDVVRLHSQLDTILSPSSNSATANASSSIPSARDWRERVKRIHSSVQTVAEAVNVLLGGGSSDNTVDPERLEAQLRTTLTQLEAELDMLSQQARKEI